MQFNGGFYPPRQREKGGTCKAGMSVCALWRMGGGGRLRKRVSCSLVCTWDLYHTIVILQQDNDPSAIRRFPKYIWCVDTLCLLSGVCIDRWKGILTPLSAQV